jgi:hypothetical protein
MLNQLLKWFGVEYVKEKYSVQFNRIIKKGYKFSGLGEQALIHNYLSTLNPQEKFVVDIAASNGVVNSNTYPLFEQGYVGLALEYNAELFSNLARFYKKFSEVNLLKLKITVDNVLAVLDACNTPKSFAFLNLDIDSYDYFILDKMLSQYRPQLICAEINENIPPPIKFTVICSADEIDIPQHFHGQSIAQLELLAQKYQYDLVELHYNNAFLIPSEINSKYPKQTAQEAYNEGYLNKPDRKIHFHWNQDMESTLTLEPAKALEALNQKFKQFAGKYTIEI